jgi:phosphoglucosamine mutase
MLSEGYCFGGEQSGHIIFLEHNLTGDGLLTALQVAYFMRRKGQPMSKMVQCMTPLPQVLIGGRVGERVNLDEIDDIIHIRNDIEHRLGSSGRLLVRYSGTEPIVRVMLEGPDKEEITQMAKQMLDTILKHAGTGV